jgi:hypothetical protein
MMNLDKTGKVMDKAYFHFHSELTYFLPRKQKNAVIEHCFDWRASIKDMIESLGVPHAEVELMVVNGVSVDFSYIVQPGDQIEVYSRWDAVAIMPRLALRPPRPDPARFVLDVHLGRLAAYLRMGGFDTLYRNDYDDEELAQISNSEERILLTRDIGLLKRSMVIQGYFIRETNPRRQLAEVMGRFDLFQSVIPFKHCMKCNGLLEPVAKEAILKKLPPGTSEFYDVFHRCQSCDQTYWKGAHYRRMQDLMNQILKAE